MAHVMSASIDREATTRARGGENQDHSPTAQGLASKVSADACPCCVHNGSMHSLAACCLNVIITQPWRHCEGLCYGTAEAGDAIWISAACARGQKSGTVSVRDANGRPRQSEILCSHVFRGAKRGLQPARPRCPGAKGAARSSDLGFEHQPGLTLLSAATARPTRDLRALQQLAQRG